MDHARLCFLLDRTPVDPGPDTDTASTLDRLRAQVAAGDALERVVRAYDGIPVPDAVAQAAARVDQASAGRAVHAALRDHLLDPAAPIAMLAPDVLVHAPTLVAAAVFTHRLSAQEHADGDLQVHTDLAGLQHVHAPQVAEGQVFVEDLEGGVVVWRGPYGWLDAFPLDALLAVRTTADAEVCISVLDGEPALPPAPVRLLRAVYEADVGHTGLPVTAEDLALGMLLRDRAVFARPLPPLTELAAAAGLEQRGHEFADDPAVWERAAGVDRQMRLTRRLGRGRQADDAVRAVDLIDTGGREDVREALDLLRDDAVLAAVAAELPTGREPLVALAERMLPVADLPARSAVAHWFAAVAAEGESRVLDALDHLRAASRAAPGWAPADRRLAGYECDRGDAASAVARLAAIGTPAEDPDLVLARSIAELPAAAPLPLRARWLAAKAEAHLRRCREGETRSSAEVADLRGAGDRLAVDVLLHEGGGLARFVAARGALLPADEAALAGRWAATERTVYDVVGIRPGGGSELRDLRNGEQVHVAGCDRGVGALVCGRAVPDGATLRLVGELLDVPRARAPQLHRVLQRYRGRDLVAWVAAANGPAEQLVEGDPKVHCTVVLRVSEDPAAALDARYLRLAQTWWAWLGHDGEVCGSILADGGELTVSVSSEALIERLLLDLATALPSFTVVDDERRPAFPFGMETA